MTFTIAIIGRPNVGKSTLFNRLTGKKHALVNDQPGVTRDRREGMGNIASLSFKLIDTAGLEEAEKDALETRMFHQTARAVDEADLVLMVVDGRSGITPIDQFFADWVRKQNKSIVLLVNKCEGKIGLESLPEAYRLGVSNDIIGISAEHGDGMADLHDAIDPFIEQYQEQYGDLDIDDESGDKAIQIAIVGRPNTGKSTLMNQLLKEDRVLTGPEAGITRDAISVDWKFNDTPIKLIDTAGMRRKPKITEALEKLSLSDAFRSIRFAHIGILMIDATMPFEKQDFIVADRIITEGRAMVIGLNKWDLVENKEETLKNLRFQVEAKLPQIQGISMVPISALQGNNLHKLMQAALDTYPIWDTRIATAPLNDWLNYVTQRHSPPLGKHGKRIRIKFITQGKSRPPTFMLFTNRPQDLPESYVRYLKNSLRETFKLPGVPIRLLLRSGDNPYKDKKRA